VEDFNNENMGLLKTFSGKVNECGVDEVGRGCLAGPVVACAVILPENFYLAGLRDSKKLTADKREEYSRFIRDSKAIIGIAEVWPARIDEVNILNATFEAMHLALDKLSIRPEHIICDGNQFRPYDMVPYTTIIKGDDAYLSIAAASVVAKVYRDKLMDELAKEFPVYAWERNKGYGTKAHTDAIRKNGLTKYHRVTFINSKMTQVEDGVS